MAEFIVDFPDDFMSGLFNTGSEEICTEALQEAAPILEESMKAVLKAGGHELSGELIKSIKATKAKRAKNGAFIVNVRPTGYSSINSYAVKGKGEKVRKYPLSNTAKAIFLEYGVNGRQMARPFLDASTNRAQTAALRKMQEVYERKVGANES